MKKKLILKINRQIIKHTKAKQSKPKQPQHKDYNLRLIKSNMAETIVDGTLFNTNIISYSSPKTGGSGGKSINIYNKNVKTGLRISTPLMLTWGASDFVDEKTGKGNGKYEMSLVFPNAEYETPETTAFLKNMQAFEAKIKADALENSKDWFGKVHKNAEVVDALYSPMLKYAKDKTTGEPDLTKSPLLKVKLECYDGVWKSEIYDEDGEALFPSQNKTPLDFILKGINVAVIMQCGGLWFANGKFGVTWKLVQAVVQKPKTSISGTCFIKLKPADKEKLKASLPEPEESRLENIIPAESTVVEVEDSDEEEDDDEEEAVPEPAAAVVAPPAPVEEKKKKVIKKKAT